MSCRRGGQHTWVAWPEWESSSTEFGLPPPPELSLFCSKCLVLENTSLKRSDQSMESWVTSQLV